jgi:hypothetical protein
MSRDRSQLLDEIALREASLADARRELDAGELSRADFDAILAREQPALEHARLFLEALGPATEVARTPRVRRTRWLVLAMLSFSIALAIVLWAALVPRQPGGSATGSIQASRGAEIRQLLAEAQADTASGNAVAALAAYESVLSLDASNVVALTEAGWLDFSAGSSSRNAAVVRLGVADLRRAVDLAPTDPAPRLYYAIAADATPGNRALAAAQFEKFLALKPSSAQLAVARPFLAALGIKP